MGPRSANHSGLGLLTSSSSVASPKVTNGLVKSLDMFLSGSLLISAENKVIDPEVMMLLVL